MMVKTQTDIVKNTVIFLVKTQTDIVKNTVIFL